MESLPQSGAGFTLRYATAADIPEVARIHVAVWRSTYRRIVPQGFLDALSEERRAQQWRAFLERSPQALIVAGRGEQVAGWVAFGPCREEGESAQGEIYAIYVLADQQRRGAGQKLMNEAERHLWQAGATRISLWVLEENAVGRKFYEKLAYVHGARTKEESIGGTSLVELRYEKRASN